MDPKRAQRTPSRLADVVRELSAFVPIEVARRLHALDPSCTQPVRFDEQAAVLFADISGFSGIADRLYAVRGAESSEQLTGLLEARFSRWVRAVHVRGGEVVNFAGDALLAVFWGQADGRGVLVEPMRRAVDCALEIQGASGPGQDEGSSTRIRLGAGSLSVARLGGHQGRWEAVLCGDAADQIAAGAPRLDAGQIGASEDAWTLYAEVAEARPTPDGGAVLTGRLGPPPPRPDPRRGQAVDDLEHCIPFVPDHVRRQYEVGAGAFLAEHRALTVLFVGLPDLDPTDDDGLALAQRAVEGMQRRLRENRGALDKVSADDKGVSVLAAFGLPPTTTEHRAVGALTTALALEQDLDGLGLRHTIGIATGRAFCGPVGSALRREYTIIGTAVNRAARLMTRGSEGLRCDAETRERAGDLFEFEELGSIRLKGHLEPVEIFRPRWPEQRSISGSFPQAGRLAGREQEIARLLDALDRAGREGAIITVTGPAGIGKSSLVSELVLRSRGRVTSTTVIGGSPALRGTPFAAWRPWFSERLGLDRAGSVEERRASLEAHLADDPERRRLGPLLEPLLRLGLQDNEHTARLTGSDRAAVALDLMLDLVGSWLGSGDPSLLVIEDLHWLDGPSLGLATQVVRRIPGLVTVTSLRGATAECSVQVAGFVAQGDLLELGGLDASSIGQLLERAVGAPPDPAISRWLQARTGGNPLFCHELIAALVDRDAIARSPAAQELDDLTLPVRVEDAIMGRLDRLTPAQQLVVKTASAVGTRFDWTLLRAVLPIDRGDSELRADLEAGVDAGLFVPGDPGAGGSWSFAHGIGLDVVYRTMVGAQRQTIHQAVAEHLTSARADPPRRDQARIAHHWSRAGRYARAFDAWDDALAQAAADGHQRQVISLATRALETATLPDALQDAPPLRRARWHQQRSYALNELTDYAAAEEDIEAMGRLLGRPVPTSGAGWAWLLVRQGLRQLVHRLLPSLFVRSWSRGPIEPLRLASLGANTLVSTAYWTARSAVVFPASALWAVNLAERAGMAAPRSSLATVGFVLRSAQLPGVAGRYYERARREAEAVGDRNMLTVTVLMEAVHGGFFGRWQECNPLGEEAIDEARRLGVSNLLSQALHAHAFNLSLQGRPAQSLALYEEAAAIAATEGLRKDEFNAQVRRAALLTRMARPAAAREAVERTRLLHDDDSPLADRFIMAALEAWLAHREGLAEQAMERVERAMELLGPRAKVDPGNFDPLLQLEEVLCGRVPAEAASGGSEAPKLHGQVIRALGAIAAPFPAMKPALRRAKARQALQQGRQSAGRRALLAALKAAERLSMPVDTALARRALGGLDGLPAAERRAHLAAALEVFEARGYGGWASDVRERLRPLPEPIVTEP